MKQIPAFRSNTVALVAALAAVIVACTGQTFDDGTSDSVSNVSREVCGNAAPWAESVDYARGALARHGGRVYECLQAHRSLSVWAPDVVPALWGETHCEPGAGTGGGTTGDTPGRPDAGTTTGGATPAPAGLCPSG